MRSHRALVPILLLALAGTAAAAQTSPYTGMEGREIKALSPEEIESYLAGHGMGLAMAAELNAYPGPKHVLELAEKLELSEEQLGLTRAIFDRMHADAVRLGEAVVAAEHALDLQFSAGAITEEALRTAMGELGRLRAELRFVHLRAHLEMRALLTPHQVHTYVRMRGYGGAHDPRRHGQGSPGHDGS